MGGEGVARGGGPFVNRVDNVDNIIARFYGYGAGNKGRGVEKKVFGSQKNSKYQIFSIRGSITHGQGIRY